MIKTQPHRDRCESDGLFVFNLEPDTVKRLLSTALSRGGDYSDLFFEYTVDDGLTLSDNEVNSASHDVDFGLGIRVVKGEKTGYAYTETLDPDSMRKAALTAAAIADDPSPSSAPVAFHSLTGSNSYPVASSWNEHGAGDRKPYLEKLNAAIFAKDSRVVKVLARISSEHTRIFFANSLGDCFYDERPLASCVAQVVMKKGSEVESSVVTRSFRTGFEMLSDALVDEMAEEAVATCGILFDASQPRGGEMPVVMGAGSSGILLHEAIGHAFEADFIRKGTSVFAGRMGEKVCDPSISIVDDATILHNRGALNFDDEGVPGQKTYLVKDGILSSYLHDRISAKFFGVPSTGNGRRQNFRYNPIPRMRCTYMENGGCTLDDIIRSVKKGIYVDNFTNGQVQIGEGDFTFFVNNGRLIEDGRLTAPIKNINIIGNGPQALADIRMVAADSKISDSAWTCGKDQYVPVSCGMPSVLVGKLTVGGVQQ
jgi:TldD protein